MILNNEFFAVGCALNKRNLMSKVISVYPLNWCNTKRLEFHKHPLGSSAKRLNLVEVSSNFGIVKIFRFFFWLFRNVCLFFLSSSYRQAHHVNSVQLSKGQLAHLPKALGNIWWNNWFFDFTHFMIIVSVKKTFPNNSVKIKKKINFTDDILIL